MLRSLARLFGSPSASRRGRPAKRERSQLKIESLEDRLAPATLQLVGGLLTHTAGNGVFNNLSVTL